VVVVANFDYGAWPGQDAFLEGVTALPGRESIWLAQESRELPGAERALYASLPNDVQRQWSLVSPDIPGAELSDVMRRWPTGEWLVTARYHAALAGGWAGSKVIVLPTNEKLRAAARDLSAPLLPIDASAADVVRTLRSAQVPHPPLALADRALASCAAMLRSAVAPAG
jgi:hypothetical protein